MDCPTASSQLDLLIDAELAEPERERIEDHVRDCSACSKEQLMRAIIGGAVRSVARTTVPNQLRKDILVQLRTHQPPTRRGWKKWPVIAGVVAVCAIGALAIGSWTGANSNSAAPKIPLEQELLASHRRSLLADHLIDRVSSERHELRPWLSTHLDFSPTIPDLSAVGFVLEGARLEYINNKRSVALVYSRDKHLINVFVCDCENKANSLVEFSQLSGYNMATWDSQGLTRWVISDLSIEKLKSFVEHYRLETK